jgi:DNA adenine methylase
MTLSGNTETQNLIAKPFVKWVGGKRQLLPELETRLPEKLDVYFEPFLGGGALFFHIAHRVAVAELSDINEELILAFNAAQNNVSGLIQELSKHKNTPEHFSQIRDADRDNEYKWSWTPIQKAARFIYLNKTCFNGLYRVNSEGHFNVSYGRYSNPKIVDAENLYACNSVLCRTGVFLSIKGYLDTLPKIESFIKSERNVFVYLDPPYIPITVSSSFTQYTKDGFSMKDQLQLKDYCDTLTNMGVKWMQSNSSAPIVFEMYKNYTIDRVAVNRNVAASSGARTVVDETIIKNYES